QNRHILSEAMNNLIILLAPFAPHICEELWQTLGNADSVHLQSWPVYNEEFLIADEIEVVLQINGKLREKILVPSQATAKEMETFALASEKVQAAILGKQVIKVIAVPGKLVNIVVK